MLCGLHFETRKPLILEHLHGFLPTCSQWPHPQLLTHTLQLCTQSAFFYKNNNLKNPSLALRGTGMKSRCSTWLQLVQVQILALSPSSAGSGEAMPIKTRDTRGNQVWFYCCSKLIKASVRLHIYYQLNEANHIHGTQRQNWEAFCLLLVQHCHFAAVRTSCKKKHISERFQPSMDLVFWYSKCLNKCTEEEATYVWGFPPLSMGRYLQK